MPQQKDRYAFVLADEVTGIRPRRACMRPIASSLLIVAILFVAPANASAQARTAPDSQPMSISRRAERPSPPGATAYFSGTARITPLFDATPQSSVSGGSVTFEPGARSAWHTHPLGQVIIVTAGTGRVQRWGGPVEEISVGDVVRTPAGVKHWHGAGPTTALTHTTIQEAINGRNVDWLEKVSDAQYMTPPLRKTSNMPDDSTATRGPYADIAPALDQITQQVLFGQVWERTGLSKRDRSLITVATLVAQYRTNELPYHLKLALQNGVTKDELTELITHLAFYSGWPAANSAVEIARKVFAETAK